MAFELKRLRGPLLFLMSVSLIGCAWLMANWLEMPGPGLAALFGLSVSLFVATCALQAGTGRTAVLLAGISSLAIPITLWMEKLRAHIPDLSYALFAWSIALAVLPLTLRPAKASTRTHWRILGMSWALAGSATWLAGSYLQNNRCEFHLALVVALALLLVCKNRLRLPFPGVLALNSLVLLLVMFPLGDLIIRPRYDLEARPETAGAFYSYTAARKDPAAFITWWNYYCKQYHKMMSELGGSGQSPHTGVLAPYSHASFFKSRIQINNRGFRGPDLPDEKGDAYRIVAIGESTTFDAALTADERPWPELLEQMIRDRLKPSRPVQVINTGVPAMDLQGNLARFPNEILPLRPDMIISYHGINGFHLLDKGIPRTSGRPQPAYRPRPLKLLADAEYHWKLRAFRRKLIPQTPVNAPGISEPLDTDYARAYQQLIRIADTNHFRLVLANFSMAVNRTNDAYVIGFYRAGFPSVQWQMAANALHSRIIEQLAAQHPDLCPVDTHPGLDGQHEKFIDLIHFAHEGRQQLAENMFDGIKDTLKTDLARDQ